jgi:LysM repeat protein
LGRHSKPSRIKLPQGAPTAAAPTLAGVVAAFFLSQQLPIASADAAVLSPHPANLDAVYQPDGLSASRTTFVSETLSAPQLITATRQVLLSDVRSAFEAASHEKPSSSLPAWYKVQPGDSLSAIAQRFYNNAAAWPVLYWDNHNQIRWADDIEVGQVLRIPAAPAHIPNPPAQLEPAPVVTTAHYTPKHASSAPVQAQPPATQTDLFGPLGVIPGGAFGQCVVERESGGNPQVMNSTGHYGLFQFSYSTWVGYGGNPADFGHASVAEQERVFATALASPGGENNWAPYDGC